MKQLQSTSLVLLHHHLKALRLPTITAECEKLARQAAGEGADHLTYLLQLSELELLERERKAAERETTGPSRRATRTSRIRRSGVCGWMDGGRHSSGRR